MKLLILLTTALLLVGCQKRFAELRALGTTELTERTCYQMDESNIIERCEGGDLIRVSVLLMDGYCDWNWQIVRWTDSEDNEIATCIYTGKFRESRKWLAE
jgi:hypothetical protein